MAQDKQYDPAQSQSVDFPGKDFLRHDLYPAISAAQTPSLKQPDKVVLITGAGRGIGRATALQYAHAGVASIVLCARTTSQLDEVESEIKKIDGNIRVLKFPLDVTDDAAVKACTDEVRSKEKRLDVLINNAGASSSWVPIGEGNPSDYWKAVSVNLKGPYLMLHFLLPLMQATAAEYGSKTAVVNMSTIGSLIVFPGISNYNIAKVALNSLTQFVNAEYGDKGVVAFAVHPGGVDTVMARSDETFDKVLNGRKYPIMLYS